MKGLALPIIRYKGFLVYANLNEEDGTVACWPCAMDRAPLLSVPPVTLAIFSEVPLKEFEPSYQKLLYEDALERGKRKHEMDISSMKKKDSAPKLDEAFLLSVTEYHDDEAFHEDGGNEDDVPPGIDVPENGIKKKKTNSIQSLSSLPGSPMIGDSKPPGLSLRNNDSSPPFPPPPSLPPILSNNEHPTHKIPSSLSRDIIISSMSKNKSSNKKKRSDEYPQDVLMPTHKIPSSLSRDIIISSMNKNKSSNKKKTQDDVFAPTRKIQSSNKRSENEDSSKGVWGPVLEKMRDRLTVLEEQERNHRSKNQEILKRLQVQEAGSRLAEKTNPMIVKMNHLSDRMMRMESKMQSNTSSSTYDEEEVKQRVLDVENNLQGEMRVIARRLRLFEQRRTEDHEMLQSLVTENTKLRNRIERMEKNQQVLMNKMREEHETFVESTRSTNSALQREIEALQRLLIRQSSPSPQPPPPPPTSVDRHYNHPKARRVLNMLDSTDTKESSPRRVRVVGSGSRKRQSPKDIQKLNAIRSRNRLLERQIERLENRLPY
eukprot:g4604.t1